MKKIYFFRKNSKWGKWTILSQVKDKLTGGNLPLWKCVCECGRKDTLNYTALVRSEKSRQNGNSRSRTGCFWCGPRTHGMSYTREYKLFAKARGRARSGKLKFDLSWTDFQNPPTHCPLLGLKLIYNSYEDRNGNMKIKGLKNHPNNASVDRIDPYKGYTKDNVWIISYRANLLKNQGTLEEIELIAKNLRKKIQTMRRRTQ